MLPNLSTNSIVRVFSRMAYVDIKGQSERENILQSDGTGKSFSSFISVTIVDVRNYSSRTYNQFERFATCEWV